MPLPQEEKLIKLCKKWDRAAQKKIYDGYASLFFTICSRYAKDMQDAEQLMQDGFLKIFNNIEGYEGKGSFEGWMKRILVNQCLDYLKSKRHKEQKMVFYPEMISEIDWHSQRNSGLDNLESEYLVKWIQELSPTTQAVFNLFVFEGYSHKDIAKELKMSEGTSQWHINNARKILKDKILELKIFEDRINEAK